MEIQLTVYTAGLIASLSLLGGGIVGLKRTPSQRVLATILAFASGTFITALATDLFAESVDDAGIVLAGGCLIAGASVYVLVTNCSLLRTSGP